MSPTADLPTSILEAFQALEPRERVIMALAMLHGVPIRQLASDAQPADELQDTMIGALRKLRKSLDGAGCSSARLQEELQRHS